ncbi:MAG: hypothetical protein Q8K65_02350, partial [Alphaproteobacteria bacterium]|nr:hypothetical protein [Alphaproteobacteria bacterium]
ELLYYMRVEPGTNNRGGFYYMQSYNLQPLLDIKRLQEIIKEKEKRFNSYKKYSENWLLIAFDRTEPAHDQCLDVPLQELSSLSPNQFDRVFLYRTYESDPIMITKSKGAIRLVGDDYVVF